MPRSTADATRFTPTGPYATSKPATFSPNARSSTVQIPTSGAPAGETPQQKIARLKAAARQAKAAQEQGTTFERIAARGRVWADRAHRVTTAGLIGFTGIAALITAVSLTDMILYNRRKRREFYAEKAAERQKDLIIAREAFARGTADEDQILLLNQESAAEEAKLAKNNRPGMFKRATSWMFSGYNNDDPAEAKETLDVEEFSERGGIAEHAAQKAGFKNVESAAPGAESGLGILQAVNDSRRQGERVLPSNSAGPLDALGEEAAQAARSGKQGWSDWIQRK